MTATVRQAAGSAKYRDPTSVRAIPIYDQQTGPLYVLLPGMGAEGEVMGLVAAELKRRRLSCVIIEAPGFGQGQPKGCGITLQQAAQQVLNSGHVTRPAIYVGHSGGGMLALELAARDERTLGVVLLNGLLDDISNLINRPWRWLWRHPLKAYWLLTLVIYLSIWLPEPLLRWLETPRHPLGRIFWAHIKQPTKLGADELRLLVRHNRCRGSWRLLWANRHYDLCRRAAFVKRPLMVIAGSSDPLTTKHAGSRFLAACDNQVQVVEIDGGHCLQLEQPEIVAAKLSAFGQHLRRQKS